MGAYILGVLIFLSSALYFVYLLLIILHFSIAIQLSIKNRGVYAT